MSVIERSNLSNKDLRNNMIEQIMAYFNKALEIYVRLACLEECRYLQKI